MKRRVIELEIIDEIPESGVSAIALVDSPAINVEWMAFRKEKFVKPQGGETEDEFVSRCIGVLVGDEGYEQDQAAAICYDSWREDKFLEPNPCWEGYEAYGLKEDGTPNCIPVENKKQKLSIDTSNLPPYVDELPKKRKFISYSDYPESAKNNAKRALNFAEKNGWGDCGTPVGKQRANQLAKGEPITEETIARMAAFERHRQNSDTPYTEGCGKLMWDAWGGDSGIAWAQRKLKEIRKEDSFQNNVKLHEQPTKNPGSNSKDEAKRGTEQVHAVSGRAKSARYFSTNPTGSKTRMFLDEDQRIIVGPAMIPGLEIVRQDENTDEIYYVKFSEETVSKISEKFMRELRNKDTNILHQEDLPADSYVMESWIVETKDDKAMTKYGFEVPIGTWMVKMRVTNPKVWKLVKEGKLRGLSIEGSFVDKEEVEDLKRGDILDKIIKILNEE